MIVYGLTGGIGSGKSTVCRIFESLDIPVFYADLVGKELMANNDHVRRSIINLFGSNAYNNGELNRSYIAEIVFNDKSYLNQLNGIIHPAVREAGRQWKLKHALHTYGIQEVAILFESGAFRHVDKVITVHAPQEVCIARVINRDGVSEENVRARMNNQISSTLRLSLSDHIIINDGSQPLIPQVIRLHKKFSRGIAYN